MEGLKLFISERLIWGLLPDARISTICERWQNQPDDLKACDIIFGCLDGYQNRAELGSLTRRALIPYIDIGMDVRNDINNICCIHSLPFKDGLSRVGGSYCFLQESEGYLKLDHRLEEIISF